MSSRRPARSAMFAAEAQYAGGATVGERKNQEDCHAFEVAADGSELLAVLADGMGGHAAGEVASQEAVRTFVAAFRAAADLPVPQRLSAALDRANRALGERIARQPDLSGMGCTLVAAHCGPAGLVWISVGDSPLFLLRDGKISQINADHSMAGAIEEGVRAGRITREEADSHPARNALRSALLGESEPELIDLRETALPLTAGDRVILASDGLQTLADAEIGRIAQKPATARDAVAALLQAVERAGKPRQDNTSVQVIMPGADRAAGSGDGGNRGGTLLRVLGYLAAGLAIAVASALLTLWYVYSDHGSGGGTPGKSGETATAGAPGWQSVGGGAGHDTPIVMPSGKAGATAAPTPNPTPTKTPHSAEPPEPDKQKHGAPDPGKGSPVPSPQKQPAPIISPAPVSNEHNRPSAARSGGPDQAAGAPNG